MPTFYTEDLYIDVNEFLSACDKRDIEELIDYLIKDGFLFEKVTDNLGIFESEFFKKIDKLKTVYYTISNEDLVLIDNMVKKYC